MKVLLFVQTGDARPKCAGRGGIMVQGLPFLPASQEIAQRAADRWWLVECANAEDGRKIIARGPTDYQPIMGRILASGGRALAREAAKDDESAYAAADRLLAEAQRHVEALRAANDDSEYGLLQSAHEHIIAARGDLDADLK